MKEMKKTCEIKIFPEDIIVQASHTLTVLENLLNLKLQIDHSCGGSGTCGTCRVLILDGLDRLPSPNEVEKDFIQERQLGKEERLSCQLYSETNISLKIINRG